MDTDTPQLAIATFWWSRCRFHMGLNAVRVVAVFTALQILSVITTWFNDYQLFGIVLLFLTVLLIAKQVFKRFQSSPRYLWIAAAIFGHVAGFTFKSFVFRQVIYFKLFDSVWLILLALLLVSSEMLVFVLLFNAKTAISTLCKNQSISWFGSCCNKKSQRLLSLDPSKAKSRVRVEAAVTDVYAESFSFIVAYLVYAFFKAAIRGMSTKQIRLLLFKLEEPPCFRHAEHHNSTMNKTMESNVVHGRRRMNEEEHPHSGDHTWIENDGMLLILFLVCFFALPVLEYWLRAASHQLQLQMQHSSDSGVTSTGNGCKLK